jgi:hypothetical protein
MLYLFGRFALDVGVPDAPAAVPRLAPAGRGVPSFPEPFRFQFAVGVELFPDGFVPTTVYPAGVVRHRSFLSADRRVL